MFSVKYLSTICCSVDAEVDVDVAAAAAVDDDDEDEDRGRGEDDDDKVLGRVSSCATTSMRCDSSSFGFIMFVACDHQCLCGRVCDWMNDK